MRVWIKRLRTALAALAAVFLLWNLPVTVGPLLTPGEDLGPAKPAVSILRCWLAEDFTGSAMQWLSKQTAAFEKANRNVRVVIRRAQPGDWTQEGAVAPDVLIFAAGTVQDPRGVLSPLPGNLPIKEAIAKTGDYLGQAYAAPLAFGGPVKLINPAKPDSAELVMLSQAEYQDFLSQKAHSLIASIREARKLSALEAAGKGFPFTAEPYGNTTGQLLMAGIFDMDTGRDDLAEAFIRHLLSAAAQDALWEYGLLPAGSAAEAVSAESAPLLAAMEAQMLRFANAFDGSMPGGLE